ncbi:MAG: hypothetical protein IJ560_03360, partial [Alphaproteobacteria bacterium]|nr:hypothetical protein [Alphaproteobacteria bacterium]
VHNRWRVDDSDTLITTNTTIPFSYVRDIKLTAAVDMTQDYVIDNGRLLWANPNLYLSNAESEQSYINTGVVPTMDTAIECRIMYVGASSGGSGGNPFGARDTNSVMGNGTNAFGFYCANNYLSGFNYGDNVFRKIYSNGEWRVMYLNANGAARIDDTEYNLTPVATTLTSRPMYMFSFNQAGTPQVGRMKISYCKLWHGNVLYRHWVPVYAGMQIGNTHITQNGMFDMVEQKLYPPLRGSGFTYGRD